MLFINNLGGISQLEMGAIVETARVELSVSNSFVYFSRLFIGPLTMSDRRWITLCALDARGIFPARIYSAPFMTSLNAPGFSVSLVNVTRVHDLVNSRSFPETLSTSLTFLASARWGGNH